MTAGGGGHHPTCQELLPHILAANASHVAALQLSGKVHRGSGGWRPRIRRVPRSWRPPLRLSDGKGWRRLASRIDNELGPRALGRNPRRRIGTKGWADDERQNGPHAAALGFDAGCPVHPWDGLREGPGHRPMGTGNFSRGTQGRAPSRRRPLRGRPRQPQLPAGRNGPGRDDYHRRPRARIRARRGPRRTRQRQRHGLDPRRPTLRTALGTAEYGGGRSLADSYPRS